MGQKMHFRLLALTFDRVTHFTPHPNLPPSKLSFHSIQSHDEDDDGDGGPRRRRRNGKNPVPRRNPEEKGPAGGKIAGKIVIRSTYILPYTVRLKI